MTIQEFNTKVVAGGYDWDTPRLRLYRSMTLGWPNVPAEMLLLDPEAWKAVGEVEGWAEKLRSCGCCGKSPQYCRCCDFEMYEGWKHKMHRLIDHLAEGGTIESYLATL